MADARSENEDSEGEKEKGGVWWECGAQVPRLRNRDRGGDARNVGRYFPRACRVGANGCLEEG